MIKRIACIALLAFCGTAALTDTADAHWRRGGWGWGGYRSGFYWGVGSGWGYGPGWGGAYYSPYYAGPAYYAPPYPNYYAVPRYTCGSRLIKVRRHGTWVWRRVAVRCY